MANEEPSLESEPVLLVRHARNHPNTPAGTATLPCLVEDVHTNVNVVTVLLAAP